MLASSEARCPMNKGIEEIPARRRSIQAILLRRRCSIIYLTSNQVQNEKQLTEINQPNSKPYSQYTDLKMLYTSFCNSKKESSRGPVVEFIEKMSSYSTSKATVPFSFTIIIPAETAMLFVVAGPGDPVVFK